MSNFSTSASVRRRDCGGIWHELLLLMLLSLSSTAAIAQQLDASHFREVAQCGTAFFGRPPSEVTAAFKKAHLGPAFRRTLLDSMSPYAPAYEQLAAIDPETDKGIATLIAINSTEMFRERYQVDTAPARVLTTVFTYYMSLADSGHCHVPEDVKTWIDGLRFDKLQKQPDLMGVPFAKLDSQQAEIAACATKALGATQENSPQRIVAHWVAKNGKTLAVVTAAKAATASSASSDRIAAALDGNGSNDLADNDEARSLRASDVLVTVANSDPDFSVRLKAQLVFVNYLALASEDACPVPGESRHVIESLSTSNVFNH